MNKREEKPYIRIDYHCDKGMLAQMDKEKQVEEMARKMCRNYKQDGNCASDDEPCALECVYGYCAERIYCAGYRKASEVAREIFAAVDSMLDLVCAMTGLEITIFGKYAELKKKYTESEDTNESKS